MISFFLYVGTVLVLLVFLFRRYALRKKVKAFRYPPGPSPFPLVGNLFSLPIKTPWIFHTRNRAKYGNIMHLELFGQHIVIVNSAEVASDLFDKRSKIYSDRTVVPIVQLFGWDFNTSMIPYGEKWRMHRRLFHQCFRSHKALLYRPAQLTKVHDYLRCLLNSPHDFEASTRSFSAAIIMKVVYDYDIAPEQDRFADIAEKALQILNGIMNSHSSALVNIFPSLSRLPEWFPDIGFQHRSRVSRELLREMQEAPLDFVKGQMMAGKNLPCMVSDLLEGNSSSPEQEDAIKFVAATAYSAGVDTTISSALSILLAITLYPDAVKKAQAEIDKVVGNSRLPDYGDRSSLPYVEAFYREVMRWHPAVPLGIPHTSTEDDVYQGYFVPKGAIVISNIWAMTRDERKYKDPDVFNPDRFFTPDGKLNDDNTILAFGFGRRICVGRHIADASLWATVVSLLAVFDIAKAKDENGNNIEVKEEYSGALINYPTSFKCEIRPRSEKIGKLVLDTVSI